MSKTIISDNSHFAVCAFGLRGDRFAFTFYDEFFNGYIVYKIYEDRIEFRKPNLDSFKKALKSIKKFYGFSITISEVLNIKSGSYNLEPIEDEDVRTFYFEEL